MSRRRRPIAVAGPWRSTPRPSPALREHRKAQAAERLAFGPAYSDEGLVFCQEDGAPLHPDRVSKMFAAHVQALGCTRITPHGLRHTWASLALQAGVNPKVVSERLGHATVSFTLDTYSHVMPGMQEDAAAAVADLVLRA
jgi:integrase